MCGCIRSERNPTHLSHTAQLIVMIRQCLDKWSPNDTRESIVNSFNIKMTKHGDKNEEINIVNSAYNDEDSVDQDIVDGNFFAIRFTWN